MQLLSQPPSQCLWKESFVLLHLLLCVERKWFAFCMLFIEIFSTEMASPPPDGSEHPRTAATHHLMSYFLIGSSCSQTLWLLWADAQLYRLWASCSEARSSLSLLSFVLNMPKHPNKCVHSFPGTPVLGWARRSPWKYMYSSACWGGKQLYYQTFITCWRTVTRIITPETEILYSDDLLFPEIVSAVSPCVCFRLKVRRPINFLYGTV